MAPESEHNGTSKNHQKSVLLIIVMMILVNLVARYPMDRVVPHGSDSLPNLELGMSLQDNGQAKWILTPWSYFGLYPLSYPSGSLFLYGEYAVLADCGWNEIPLIFGLVFTVLMVLGGFVLLRAFRLSDVLAAVLSGLMALSPLFLYYTYEQASARGFMIPILVLTLSTMSISGVSARNRFVLLLTFIVCGFTFHRMAVFVTLLVAIWYLTPNLSYSSARAVSDRMRTILRVAGVFSMVALLLWPFMPVIGGLVESIPGLTVVERIGEFEFQSGYFLEGDSALARIVNLASNYVGSLGLAILVVPLGILSLITPSRDSARSDLYLILVLLLLAPVMWIAGYVQPVFLPFAYILVGLGIQRRRRTLRVASHRLASLDLLRTASPGLSIRVRCLALISVIVVLMVFSVVMFSHRANISYYGTGIQLWSTDDEANLGIYLDHLSDEDGLFVSPAGLLTRQVRWFSGWSSPTSDQVNLLTEGYLQATSDDFTFSPSEQLSMLEIIMTFYSMGSRYALNQSVEGIELYSLSDEGKYGYYMLYFIDPDMAIIKPGVSTSEAGVSIVIKMNSLGNMAPDFFRNTGFRQSHLLTEVSQSAYVLYVNPEYSAYLAATPIYGV